MTLQAVTPLPRAKGTTNWALYRLHIKLPAAGPAPARLAQDVTQTFIYARPALQNRPPKAELKIDGRPVQSGSTLRLRKGTRLRLDASLSSDLDGDRLIVNDFLFERRGRQWIPHERFALADPNSGPSQDLQRCVVDPGELGVAQ